MSVAAGSPIGAPKRQLSQIVGHWTDSECEGGTRLGLNVRAQIDRRDSRSPRHRPGRWRSFGPLRSRSGSHPSDECLTITLVLAGGPGCPKIEWPDGAGSTQLQVAAPLRVPRLSRPARRASSMSSGRRVKGRKAGERSQRTDDPAHDVTIRAPTDCYATLRRRPQFMELWRRGWA